MSTTSRFHVLATGLRYAIGAWMTLGIGSIGSWGLALADLEPTTGAEERRAAKTLAGTSSVTSSSRMIPLLPLAFEAGGAGNAGPFHARGPGYLIDLDRGKATLHLPSDDGTGSKPSAAWNRVALRLVGARRSRGVGLDPLRAHASHFIGSDPSRWRSAVPLYSRVRFDAVYPGIDLLYYGSSGTIEHDFEVASGADPARIRLALDGADTVRVSDTGDLVVSVDANEVLLRKPVAYQTVAGGRRDIEAAYVLRADRTIGFQLGDYDRTAPLVIDPIITYSTFLGGALNADEGKSVVYDHSGFAYVFGGTTDFPVTGGAYDTSVSGNDVFVAKIDPNQSGAGSLVWATYIGGTGNEGTGDIAVDAASNVYIVVTAPTGFPTTAGAFDTTFNGGLTDIAVAKLNPTGSALLWSTFLGGSDDETGVSLTVDLSGVVVVVGPTSSSNFPTTSSGYDRSLATAPDGFLSVLSPDGSRLLYSTFFGGNGVDSITSVALDGQARAYVTGVTWSSDFPVTSGAFDNTLGGTTDGFAARFDPSLASTVSLGWATYLGGSLNFESGSSIALAPGDEPVVMGYTNSTDFPGTSLGFDTTVSGPFDMFVARLTNDGSNVTYGTYVGGSSSEGFSAQTLAVDDFGRAHLGAEVQSTDYPATAGSIAPCSSTASSIAYTVVDTNVTGAASLVESGCAGPGWAHSTAVDSCGNSVLTGFTTSALYPIVNGYDAILGGTRDAFVMQLHSTGAGGGADLAVTVDDSPDPIFVGETVTHTVTVTNNGPNSASNVQLVHRTSALVIQGTLPAQCSASGASVTCDLGTIGSGGSVPLTLQGTAPLAGQLWAESRGSSTSDDSNCTNNGDTAVTTVLNPALNLNAPNGG